MVSGLSKGTWMGLPGVLVAVLIGTTALPQLLLFGGSATPGTGG